jgi:hypothetical protein
MSSVLHAVADSISPPTRRAVDPSTGQIVPVKNTTGQRIAGGIGTGLEVMGSALSAAGGRQPINYVAQSQAAQQKQLEAQSESVQSSLRDQGTIAYHNSQMLNQQRTANRDDAEATARWDESNRVFHSKAVELGWQKPPIIVNGQDINGQPGHEADLMKYYSDTNNHKAPDGYSYLYLPVPTANGQTAHEIYMVPHDDLTNPVTMTRAQFKTSAGFDYPGGGSDPVRMTVRDMIGFASKNAERELTPSADDIKSTTDVIDSLPHLPPTTKNAIKTMAGRATTPEHLDQILTKATTMEGQYATAANKDEGGTNQLVEQGKNPDGSPHNVAWNTKTNKVSEIPTGPIPIQPKGTSAPTQAMKTAAYRANTALAGIPDVMADIDRMGDKLGPAMGRWNDFMQGKGGFNDPDFAGLRTDMTMLSTAVTLAHAQGRMSDALRQDFQTMLNQPKQTPQNIKATLGRVQKWMERQSNVNQVGGGVTQPGNAGTGNVAPPAGSGFNPAALPKVN